MPRTGTHMKCGVKTGHKRGECCVYDTATGEKLRCFISKKSAKRKKARAKRAK